MKPNYSGEYTLDRPASTLSTHARAMVGAHMRITHEEPRFACSARFSSVNDAVEFTFERFTDGRAGDANAPEKSRCYWEHDVIVTEDRIDVGPGTMHMIWRYELTDGGRRMRATERIRGAGRDQDNVWEFNRFVPPIDIREER